MTKDQSTSAITGATCVPRCRLVGSPSADDTFDLMMLTLDAQVHAYERNHPGRPWVGTLYGPTEVTGDQMVAAMDAVGVDGAVLVSPFSMYRYDASYAKEVYTAHPDRFALVKPVDPTDPAAVADTIADWAATNGTVGIRVILRDNVSTDPADPGIN